ncbi:MAG: VPLPA-CTERM sorting domain-containing protein [Gammaproteobacteria bacterium]|nr:VPLPA-CTERM sorting domain-containing protein [Gammaproteobacteria bacterium]
MNKNTYLKKILKRTVLAGCLCLSANVAMADLITFSFTGRLTVEAPDGSILVNTSDYSINDGYQTAIAANLTYDTNLGIGSTDLAFEGQFWDEALLIHDIDLNFIEGTKLVEGNMLTDWNGSTDMSMHIMWDAAGLFNSIDYGLQAGDRISGTNLYRDFDGDGYAETLLGDMESATPLSDNYIINDPYGSISTLNQGPAPMAVTDGTLGLLDGPFPGFKIHMDIGSGNSMHVTSVSAVPVPAAVWLFGSGLIGLAGIARRKKA